jgi:hypothetical protein
VGLLWFWRFSEAASLTIPPLINGAT